MMLSKFSYRILRIFDEKTLAKYLNFEQYFSFHKFFVFNDIFAERLVVEFTFMRVDLYTFGSDIYFGGLIPCHSNAQGIFIPVKYDDYYVEKWKNHTNLIKNTNEKGDGDVVTKDV